MIGTNTLLGIDLFSDEIENSMIFHIPHSKTEIPEQFKSDFVNDEIVENEINLLTDFATDEMFTIGDLTKVVFPYSRVFCDVERLDDDNEVMFKYGRGFYYTKTDSGELLRNNNQVNKSIIHRDYYTPHHDKLTNIVDQKLKEVGFVMIVDCHSFPDQPLKSDLVQGLKRPDFCIGTDEFHTPQWVVDMVVIGLKKHGYSVEINSPYAGTIVPMKYYQKNDMVESIMIEVNRKLYMDGNDVDQTKVKELNKIMSDIFLINN